MHRLAIIFFTAVVGLLFGTSAVADIGDSCQNIADCVAGGKEYSCTGNIENPGVCKGPCTQDSACAIFLEGQANSLGWENAVCTGNAASPGTCIEASGAQLPTGPQEPNQLILIIRSSTSWIAAGVLLFAVIFIILAAFQFVSAGGDPQQVQQARRKLLYAVAGIMLVFLAGGTMFILQSILEKPELAFAISQNGTNLGVMVPLATATNIVSEYSFSNSRYYGTIVSTVKDESLVFLHLDTNTDTYSLVILHDKTNDSGGGAAVFTVAGVKGATITVADDPGFDDYWDGSIFHNNLTGLLPYTIINDTVTADWSWNPCCTDGIAISNINLESSCLTITPNFISGITSWVFVNDDQTRTPLDMSKPLTLCPSS